MSNAPMEPTQEAAAPEQAAEPALLPRATYLGTHAQPIKVEGIGMVQAGEGERLAVFLITGWEQDVGSELVRKMEACADPIRDQAARARKASKPK